MRVRDMSRGAASKAMKSKKKRGTTEVEWDEVFTFTVPDVTDFSVELALLHSDGLRRHEVAHAVLHSTDYDFAAQAEQDVAVPLVGDTCVLNVRLSLAPEAHEKLQQAKSTNGSLEAASSREGGSSPALSDDGDLLLAGGGAAAAVAASAPLSPRKQQQTRLLTSQESIITSIDVSGTPGIVTLRAIEAAELGENLAVFALVEEFRTIRGRLMKTKSVKSPGVASPFWGEDFEFEVPSIDSWECVVSLWSEDVLQSNRLGFVTINQATPADAWLEIEGGGRGRLHIGVSAAVKRGATVDKIIKAPAKKALNPVRKVFGRVSHLKNEAVDESEFHQAGKATLRIVEGEGFKPGSRLLVRLDRVDDLGRPLETRVSESNPPVWDEKLSFQVQDAESWSCGLSVFDGGSLLGTVQLLGSLASVESSWYPLGATGAKLKIGAEVALLTHNVQKRQSLATVLASQEEQKGPGVVNFLIFEGDNLLVREGASDTSEGYCDAYVRIDEVIGGSLNGKKNKTKVASKTVYPRWDESFPLNVANVSDWTVRCSVWHKSFGGDKPQGNFVVHGSSAAQPAVKVPLLDGKGSISVGYAVVSDETRATVTYGNVDADSKKLLAKSADGGAAVGPNPGYVKFFVYEATNLMAKDAGGTSDPFVVLYNTVDLEGKECKTKVVKKTLNPKWNESFTFLVPNMDRWAMRLQLFDWDMLGKDKLGYVDVLGSQQQQRKATYNVLEGSGSISVGWNVSKSMPEDDEADIEQKVAMPAERRGRLRVHVKGAEGLAKPCASVVRLVDAALDADVTRVAENTTSPDWGDWLEIDLPDLANWVIQLNVLERIGLEETLIGTVSLQADKFNLAGTTDYKTLPLSGGPGELNVGVAPTREFKRLAMQVHRAKQAMQAEEMRRAKLRTKTLMHQIGADGKYAADIAVKLLDLTGGDGGGTVFATVEGAMTPTRETVKTKGYRIGDNKPWDEQFFLHLPDVANFAFAIHLWEQATGKHITKFFMHKESLFGLVTIGSLDIDLTDAMLQPQIVTRSGADGKFVLRVQITATKKAQEVAVLIQEELEAAEKQPLVWPEDRAGVMRLHTIRGENLAVADIGGTSDPYVQITHVFDMHGEPVKSRVVKKTLNPVWDQWFDIPVPDLAAFDFTLGLWDEDIAMDDTLGYVALRAEDDWDFSEGEQKKKLVVVNGSGTVEIGLAPTLRSRHLLRRIKAAKEAGLAPSVIGANKLVRAMYSGVLRLSIISASGLTSADRNGLSDPYCIVPKGFFVDTRGREIRTKVIRKTLCPEWNEVFEFWTPDVRDFSFQISIWDWDLGRHDSLGFAVVRSKDMIEYFKAGKERKLIKVEDGEGELFIEIAASEAAQRVLDRDREEKEAEARRVAEEAERAKREARLREMCRERLKQMRDLVPQYDRKIAFDPFIIVASVLFALFVLNFLWAIYQSRDTIVAVVVWPVGPAKATAFGTYAAVMRFARFVKSLF